MEGRFKQTLVFFVLLGVGFGLGQRILIGTGGVGGVFFYYGTTIAEIWSKNGIQAQALQTGGSIDNLILITERSNPGQGLYYCGFSQSDTVFAAFTGEHPRFSGRPASDLRILFAAYPVYFHIVTRADAGIGTIHDLRGKRVSTGAPGSGIEYESLLVLDAAGIKLDQLAKRERLGAQESAQALASRQIDAFFWTSGLPASALVELASALARQGTRMQLVPLPPQSTPVQVFLRRYPGLAEPSIIPREAYGLDRDTPTLAFWAFFVCHKDLPDSLANRMLKTLFGNLDYLRSAIPAAKDTTLTNAAKFIEGRIPYHPGAVTFFKEAGVVK